MMTLNFHNASAAEWSITPSVRFGGEYSDNIYLSRSDPNEVTGSNFTPEIKFNRSNPNSTTSLGARIQFTQYSDSQIQDTDVQYLTFNSRYKTQQRSMWRINGIYKRDTTITQVSGVEGLIDPSINDGSAGDSVDTDQGLVEVEVRRNRLNLDPSWQYNLTERTLLRLGYRLLDVYYANVAGADLVDYRRHTLDTTLTHNLAKNDDLGVTIQLSQYSAPDNDTETNNVSMNIGVDHNFEQDLKGKVSVGYRDTTTTTGIDENKSGGVVLNLGINKKETKLTSYNVSLQRDVSASGIGRVLKSDKLNIRVNSRLTQRLSTTLRVTAFDNKTLEGDVTSVDRVYYSFEPSLRWSMTRDWSIEGSYLYRHQKRELDSDAAESNAVYMSLKYTWPKIAVSR